MLWAFEEFSTGEWSLTSMAEALKDKGLTTVPTAKYAEKPIPLDAGSSAAQSVLHGGDCLQRRHL